MPGHEQGHELVAQLLIGHRRAVGVACAQKHGQHVVPRLGAAPALIDELEQEGVGLALEACEGGERTDALEQLLGPAARRWREQADEAVAKREHGRQALAKRVETRAGI